MKFHDLVAHTVPTPLSFRNIPLKTNRLSSIVEGGKIKTDHPTLENTICQQKRLHWNFQDERWSK
jgi:hypothetical protein